MWRLEYAVTLLPYTKIAPMMQCAMGAIYTVMHVYCTYFYYSHSIVKNSLQFVPVCSGESYLHPVSKIDEIPWGQIWVTVFQAILDILWGHAGSRRHKKSCLAHHAGESCLCCSAAVLKQDPLRIGVLPNVFRPLRQHRRVACHVVEDFGPTGDGGLAAPLLAC